MDKKQKKTQVTDAGDKPSLVSIQAAMWLSMAMLVIGFFGGTVFGVMKTSPLQGATQTASTQPPYRMIASLEDAADKNPQNAEAWRQLGNAYFDSDQYEKAIGAYEKSLSIEPGNPNVLTDLGVMYRRSKQPRKAVEMFSKAMDFDPTHEMSRMNKGIVLMYDLNDEEGAVEAWEALLGINPLATFGNGQTVDERVRHYREGHGNEGGSRK